MSKRGVRRHHTARVKAWYRKNVIERWRVGLPEQEWWFKESGKVRPMTPVEREEFIVECAARMAEHPSCPCGMCKRERYDRRNEWRWDRFLLDEEWE